MSSGRKSIILCVLNLLLEVSLAGKTTWESSELDTSSATTCFDESPFCAELARNGSCFSTLDAVGEGRESWRIFSISDMLLRCRTSCLEALHDGKILNNDQNEVLALAGGLLDTVPDPFGYSRQICNNLEFGFTLNARFRYFNAQLISVQALVGNVFHDPSFTRAGIKRARIPKKLYQELMDFRQRALEEDQWIRDICNPGVSFCNRVENDAIKQECREIEMVTMRHYNMSDQLAAKTSDSIRPLVEEWASELSLSTGGPMIKLEGSTVLGHKGTEGMRRYMEGAWLGAHIDAYNEQQIGAVLHLAHETAKPWPLHIYDLQDVHHRVKLEPGDLFMFESSKLPHGRVETLTKGWYDNVFVHYRLVGFKTLPGGGGRPQSY